MPTYEYRCKNKTCELEKFEVMAKMSESDKEQTCPLCKQPADKQMSCFGLNTSNFSNPVLDVAVGNDAAKRWEAIRERRKKEIEPAVKSGELKRGMPKVDRKSIRQT